MRVPILALGAVLTAGLIQSQAIAQDISWRASGRGGAVAAGGADAVQAGLDLLRDGGNAADGAAATLLALAVTDYGMYCIGAEAPLIIYDAKKGEVKVLCGLGTAPSSKEAIDVYMRDGIQHGTVRAVPIPGALSMIFKLLEVYGTRSFADAVGPTLGILDAGKQRWHGPLAATLRKLVERERETPGTREEKIRAARDRFYKGNIAETLVKYYRDNGGFITREDMASYQTRIEDPVRYDYRGYTVLKCDTWTQGPTLLQMLALLQGFDLRGSGHLSADTIHACVESMKLAFADRDKFYADPLFVKVPMKTLLSDGYNDMRRKLIDPERASSEVRPGDPHRMKPLSEPYRYEQWPGGTTTCTVADRWGNVVSATPSGNGPYHTCEELGISHGNRLRSLNSNPEHPNRIEPGKRPRITLTPTMVLKDGKPVIAISVAGGDLQEQTTLNILLNMVEFGMTPAEAVRAPRFNTSHHENSFSSAPDRRRSFQGGGLTLNRGIADEVLRELEKRGHRLRTSSGPIAMPVALFIDQETGMIHAAGDPRARRHAGAID